MLRLRILSRGATFRLFRFSLLRNPFIELDLFVNQSIRGRLARFATCLLACLRGRSLPSCLSPSLPACLLPSLPAFLPPSESQQLETGANSGSARLSGISLSFNAKLLSLFFCFFSLYFSLLRQATGDELQWHVVTESFMARLIDNTEECLRKRERSEHRRFRQSRQL